MIYYDGKSSKVNAEFLSTGAEFIVTESGVVSDELARRFCQWGSGRRHHRSALG